MTFLKLTMSGTIWYVWFLYLLDHETYVMLFESSVNQGVKILPKQTQDVQRFQKIVKALGIACS